MPRLVTAMITPFIENGERVNYEKAKEIALALIDSGSEGVVVSGSTGESTALTFNEKVRLFAEVKEAIGSDGVVIAGTGGPNTNESVKLTREALTVGVDGILAVAPAYSRAPQAGLRAHFTKIAEAAVPLPVIVYNVPSRTAVNLLADTVIKLSKIVNVVGIKEASGDLTQVAKIIKGTPSDFLVYSGNDSDTFPILAMGGYGVISVTSHLVGMQIREMIENFLAGNIKKAVEIHLRLIPLTEAMFIVSNPIPTKCALNLLGWKVGLPRLPLVAADGASAERIRDVLGEYKSKYGIDLPSRLPHR